MGSKHSINIVQEKKYESVVEKNISSIDKETTKYMLGQLSDGLKAASDGMEACKRAIEHEERVLERFAKCDETCKTMDELRNCYRRSVEVDLGE